MMGDDLLRYPRLHALLRRRGVRLIETSAARPHLILDHESGVLLLDLQTLRQPGLAASMVAECEIAYRSLWLLVLSTDPKSSGGADDSPELWSRVRNLTAELCASPIKLTVRVAKSNDCWGTLQTILRSRAPDPLADALNGSTSDSMMDDDDEHEETQHEAFLSTCGLNPWAARRLLQHYNLRDLLGLSQDPHGSHF